MEKISLTIQTSSTVYYPIVVEGITLDQERQSTPSKLVFKVMKDANLSFDEGAVVKYYYDNVPMFYGYVFTKKRDKEGIIEVTAYDQLRYFKNEFTYVFAKKTATNIIKTMASDFQVKVGSMENTGYVIPSLIAEKKSVMDIMLDALDETLVNSGNLFVVYDNFGSLELKNISNMKITVAIDENTAKNFDYTSSIDDETYNKIVLYYVDEKTNDRIPFYAKDDKNIKQWGILQYFEEVKTPAIAQNKANSLLKLHNKKKRELKISGAFGHPSVRAGSLMIVQLNLGDIVTNNYMLLDKVTHKFENEEYTMDLTVNGNWG